MNVIETTGLTKTYKGMRAIDDLTMHIKSNTITGVIGRNGAGKTTLLKILAGYIKETTGRVNVFSEHPFNSLYVSANSIFIDDQMVFPDALTLGELLKEGERFYADWDMTFAKNLFDYFSFHPNQRHKQLSKGKKTTFNMIFGLATRCTLTIFDEPTTGMDAAVRKDFYRVLLKDYLAHPRTILISSHYLDEMDHLLEDVLLIDEGQQVLHMPMDDLKAYAVSLIGPAAVVGQWLHDKTVLAKKQPAPGMMQAVVKKDFPIEQAEKIGIKTVPVNAGDVCIHLTAKTKGGIDDVLQ
ncbi:ABC transporter ATP-binding protein [Lentibacillus cibarius]|uniref:ABC transporter ATP-binding protein n=1 Tax=Lentibacillus cibarius TaxID=2583219 RepID=A0A549YM44_9BACI|nr:ABC transporter ATP-binding protein [Lentibacillus cibarius]TRM12952.1 ABC transporter ATP-binding protein [Lentibacillus cibarius]